MAPNAISGVSNYQSQHKRSQPRQESTLNCRKVARNLNPWQCEVIAHMMHIKYHLHSQIKRILGTQGNLDNDIQFLIKSFLVDKILDTRILKLIWQPGRAPEVG